MTNKIVILDNSVELYEHYISDEKWERTFAFPRGGLTYLISNGTIKFYAFEDYLYRNCIISMQLPVYVIDEKRQIDGEYDDVNELTNILDPIFPTNDIEAELEYYLTIADAERLYQPKGDYVLRSEVPDLDNLVTDEELAEVLDDYYTKNETSSKTEIQDALDLKADKADTYTKTEVDDFLSGKADTDDVYTKEDSDSKFQPKGNYVSASTYISYTATTNATLANKADRSELPNMNNYYTKSETSSKTEIEDALALKADKSDTYTKAETSSKTEIQDALDLKADKSDTYSKEEVDAKIGQGGQFNPDNYYTKSETSSKTEIQDALALKADKSDTYTKEEVYTKDECDAKFQIIGDYARKSDIYNYTYSKSEIDTKIAQGGIFDPSQYYNKNEVDSKVNLKLDASAYTPVDLSVYYTKSETDAKYQPKGDYATKANFITYINNMQQQINSLIEAVSGCCSTQEDIYRWLTLIGDNDYICENNNKYEKQQYQVSHDGGIIWENVVPAEYRKGQLLESDSVDCGYEPVIEPQYRWYTAPTSDYMCNGTNKYYKQYYQVSNDNGQTWQNVVPEQTRQGSLIETNSVDCGYIEPQYRVVSGTPYCEGYDKVVKTTNQVSYDGGQTWQNTGVTGKTVVEYNCEDCGWKNYKVKVVNLSYTPSGTYDKEYSVTCNGISTLSSGETQYSAYETTTTPFPRDFMYGSNPKKAIYIGSCTSVIGTGCFSSWKGVVSLDIDESVVRVESKAFSGGVASVSALTLSDSLEFVGSEAFLNMTTLKTLNVPDSVKTIEYGAFAVMTGCTAVTLGSGITSLAAYSFGDCTKLKSFTIKATTPPTFRRLFYAQGGTYSGEYPSGLKIYVPSSALEAYKDAWNPYADIIYPIS